MKDIEGVFKTFERMANAPKLIKKQAKERNEAIEDKQTKKYETFNNNKRNNMLIH